MKHFLISITCIVAVLCGCQNKSAASASISSDVNNDSVSINQKLPDKVTVAMVGDVMMGSTFPKMMLPANDGKNLFDDCRDILKNADVTCGNLEGVIADKGKNRKQVGKKNCYMFLMPSAYTKHLKDCGFDFLGLANNHIYDFYGEAIVKTRQSLADAGIESVGAKDLSNPKKYPWWAVKEIGGVKYGFAAFGHEPYELCTYETSTVKYVVKELRKQCDVVIICFHGGAEGTVARHLPQGQESFFGENRGNLRQFTHLCIDNGADVVFGSGPHVPRCIELYKGHFIAYSLGNFCTCGMSIAAQTGLAPLITVDINPKDGTFKCGKIHAFRQQRMAGPKTDKSGEVIKEIRSLTNTDIKDGKLSIADDGTITIK